MKCCLFFGIYLQGGPKHQLFQARGPNNSTHFGVIIPVTDLLLAIYIGVILNNSIYSGLGSGPTPFFPPWDLDIKFWEKVLQHFAIHFKGCNKQV